MISLFCFCKGEINMATFTAHAKERLKQRYDISSQREIEIIGHLLNSPNKYKVVNKKKYNEIRQIIFNDKRIQAAVSHNHIITFIPATFEAIKETASIEEQRIEIEKIKNKILVQKNRMELLEKNLNNMLPKNYLYLLFTSFIIE